MRAMSVSVTDTISAERGSPSIAAKSPKMSPAASHLESKFATLQEGVIADAGREAGAESVNGAF
jgi:hypothetical protein